MSCMRQVFLYCSTTTLWLQAEAAAGLQHRWRRRRSAQLVAVAAVLPVRERIPLLRREPHQHRVDRVGGALRRRRQSVRTPTRGNPQYSDSVCD